jgi:hypothetical protein
MIRLGAGAQSSQFGSPEALVEGSVVRAASSITSAAGGAVRIMSLLMPV